MAENGKPRFVMCICTGECPGFEDLDLWPLMNRVRNELDVEYDIVHPQLCVEDGDRFWHDYAKPGVTYVVGACAPTMQRKMFKDALADVGADFDEQVVPLDLRNMSTEEAFQKVADAVADLKA